MNLNEPGRGLVLGMVAACLLTSCTNRTILRGWNGTLGRSAAQTKYLNIWFVKNNAQQTKLVCVKRRYASGDDTLKQAVQDLLGGPNSSEERAGLGTEIPRGTLLLAVQKQGRNFEVNLSHRFAMDGGTNSFETRLAQLRKTVTQAAPGADVYLNIEGKRLKIEEGEGIEVPQPINRVASQSDDL